MGSLRFQAEALAGGAVLQQGLVPELGAQGARCCSGRLGGRGQLGAQEGAVEAELGGTAGLQETRGRGSGGRLGRRQLRATGRHPTHLEEGAWWEQGLGARGQPLSTDQGPPTAEEGLSHGHEAGRLLVARLCLQRWWPVAGEDICRAKQRQGQA